MEIAAKLPFEIRDGLLKILNERGKSAISYSICKNGEYVGEITFQNENLQQPEIGIELEEPFQRRA